MTAPHRLAREAHRAALHDYFTGGAADLGLSSSWLALAGLALGGVGSGTPDPERRLIHRVQVGPASSTAVTRAREVRRALASLPAPTVDVLWAAFGPTPWLRVVDQAFGRGMGARVEKRLPSLAGVALLTPMVAAELPAYLASQPPERRSAWRTAGGLVVATAIDTSEGGKARAGRLRGQAEAMVGEALAAYGAAAGRLTSAERFRREYFCEPLPLEDMKRPAQGDRRRRGAEA